jgi:hypothetical protein
MTPNDLIKLSLKMAGVIGIGQTPLSEDMNDAFSLLNMMLGQWNRRRWLVYHLIETVKVATGALSYSIGPGGDFDVPRVTGIDAAFVRLLNNASPNQVDFPLQLVESYDDYATIPLKSQAGFPQTVFLDTGTPLGTLYVWPLPSNQYEMHLIVRAALAGFDKISDDVDLPNEYQEALLYNLAARLRPAYQLGPDPSVTALAMAALNTIRTSNVQVPLLEMPSNLVRPGLYNVYSDRYR